jgi:SAM-dependent methyltransferase
VLALSPEQAQRVYDRIGRAQDWQRFYEDAATTELIAHAAFDAAHAVVELGCGTGRFAAGLLGQVLPSDATYLGVDVSARMVGLASARLLPWAGRARVALVGGTERLPEADGAADRFVANYVFDLLSPEATRDALAEARRTLAPGGLLCAAGLTDADHGIPRLVSSAWRKVWTRWPVLVGGCRPVTLGNALGPTEWEIRARRVVVSWGIPSEVVIAARR